MASTTVPPQNLGKRTNGSTGRLRVGGGSPFGTVAAHREELMREWNIGLDGMRPEDRAELNLFFRNSNELAT